MILSPSILSCDFFNLNRQIQDINASTCQWIHIDVMDGYYVPNMTFGPDFVRALRTKTNKYLDAHFMVQDNSRFLAYFHKTGLNQITLHPESSLNIYKDLEFIKNNGMNAGVALNPGRDFQDLHYLLPLLDTILIMTVNPGFGGQTFIHSMVAKIVRLKAYLIENNAGHIRIQVDGGITPEIATLCQKAGANVFVAGHSIFSNRTIQENISAFDRLLSSD